MVQKSYLRGMKVHGCRRHGRERDKEEAVLKNTL